MMPPMRFPWALVSGLGMLALFFAVYFPIAPSGAYTGREEYWIAYGERPVAGWIKQPACFWSALAFSISGLAVLLWLDLTAGSETPGSPMTGRTVFSVPLGLLTVWLGPGSMLEHGTLQQTWGWFDASSIHWYALYVIGYLILRWIPGGTGSWAGRIVFWVAHAACCVLIGVWGAHDPTVLEPWSIGLLVGTGVLVLLTLCLQGPFGLDFEPWCAWISFGVGMALTAFGVAVQKLGYERGPADDWGHPVWHVCVGLVTFCIFLILRAERPRGTAPTTNPGQGGSRPV